MEKEKLTNKDVDREILMKLDDYSFLKACSANNYFKNKVCDEDFIRRRLQQTYPNTLRYKFPNQTWKEYYLETIKYIADLTFKGHGIIAIPYNVGNVRELFYEMERIKPTTYRLSQYIEKAVDENKFAKAEYFEKYGKIDAEGELHHTALEYAVRKGNLRMVKYLVEKVPYTEEDIFMNYIGAKKPDIISFLKPKVPEDLRMILYLAF